MPLILAVLPLSLYVHSFYLHNRPKGSAKLPPKSQKHILYLTSTLQIVILLECF
jgi:hypothetical protein